MLRSTRGPWDRSLRAAGEVCIRVCWGVCACSSRRTWCGPPGPLGQVPAGRKGGFATKDVGGMMVQVFF